jgi:hypothetical protein
MIYLHVSYDQKDEAKALGAKWDPQKKLWYAPDSTYTKLIESYSALVPKPPRVKKLDKEEEKEAPYRLKGENLDFGGNELYVDLVPKGYQSLKLFLPEAEYTKLRSLIVKRAGYRCEICQRECLSKDNQYLQLCERFRYDRDTLVQKLERIMGVCKECHQTVRVLDKGVALKRLMDINELDKEDAKQHILDAYDIWKERSKHTWKVDRSILPNDSNESKEYKKTSITIHKLDHAKMESNGEPKSKIKNIGEYTGKIRINKMNTEICQIDDE